MVAVVIQYAGFYAEGSQFEPYWHFFLEFLYPNIEMRREIQTW